MVPEPGFSCLRMDRYCRASSPTDRLAWVSSEVGGGGGEGGEGGRGGRGGREGREGGGGREGGEVDMRFCIHA